MHEPEQCCRTCAFWADNGDTGERVRGECLAASEGTPERKMTAYSLQSDTANGIHTMTHNPGWLETDADFCCQSWQYGDGDTSASA